MIKLLQVMLLMNILIYLSSAIADTCGGQEDNILRVKISKSGLNRISNPPYKIIQVTGDNSKYHLKYDKDGTSVYVMPLVRIGQIIPISVRNNAGYVQDMELEITDIKSRSIKINTGQKQGKPINEQEEIAVMLRAMKEGKADKYYVQEINKLQAFMDSVTVWQSKLYKYKHLVGGVFIVQNTAKTITWVDLPKFCKRFAKIRSSFISKELLDPRETAMILIVQEQ